MGSDTITTSDVEAVHAATAGAVSSYRPGQGQGRTDEMSRLDRQAELTFDVELDLLIAGGLAQDGLILDLGSGNGAVTKRLRQALPQARVVAVDVDADLLSLVPPPALLIRAGRIPLEDDSADDIVVRFVAQHLRPAARAELWTEVLRVLRPGGRVHVIDVDDTDSGVTTPRQPGLAPIFAKLHHAQSADGGDRMVIGKVVPELDTAGFQDVFRERGEVTSTERNLSDFAVHVGPERHVPHVATGVLTLADLAVMTRGWQAILADPAAYICIYVHLVRAVKPGANPLGRRRGTPATQGEAS